jgi:hypothetical protein
MNKQKINWKRVALFLMLVGMNSMTYAQDIGLGQAGQNLLNEVKKAFPFVAGIAFIFTGWKAFNEYNENGKDAMAAMKVFIWFAVILGVFIGIFRFVTSKSL